MIGLIVGMLVLCLVVVVVFGVWSTTDDQRQRRVEQAQINREVSRAEHRLYNMASNAFASMLDAARGRSSGGCEGHR
ncbi:MAG TPA: hypothetical protein VNE42_12025 [Acidimicrobiales bacterium]|nr:hypothetical protein [Acidimicrobiales bacterium]